MGAIAPGQIDGSFKLYSMVKAGRLAEQLKLLTGLHFLVEPSGFVLSTTWARVAVP